MKLIYHKVRGRDSQRERGMLLIECLVYIALLLVVLNLAYAAYNRCADNSKRLSKNVDDVVRVLQAGELWRDDIRAATNIAAANDALHLTQRTAAIDYVFADGAVWRRAGADGPLTRFLPAVKSSHMEKDARREVAAWRWNVELLTRGAPGKFRPLFTFEAVPPGAPP